MEIKQDYNCKQSELYAASDIIIQNLTNDRLAFFAKKAKYTVPFIGGIAGLRTTAMGLPDEESRNAVHQTAKGLLPGLLLPCQDNFNDLKGYIRDGWPNENPKPRYEAAGLNYYNDIKQENWEAADDMNEQMKDFIAEFTAELTAPGGMPGTFGTKVDNDALAFHNQYNLFMVSRETTTARNAKITANNDLYEAIMDVCKDGVEMIYRNDSGGKKRYTFTTVLNLVSPPGAASLEVEVQTSAFEPAVGAIVKIQAEGKAAMSAVVSIDGARGVANFPNTDADKYSYSIYAKEGDKDPLVTGTKDVNTGTNARLKVVLPPTPTV